MNFVFAGIGAGLVSALLTVVVLKGTLLAVLLYLLAPLPVLIIALGWDHRSGLVAAAVGGVALALMASPTAGIGFALFTALPSWWLAYLALLGRDQGSGALEWFPAGRLLAWTAITSALSFFASVLLISGGDFGLVHQAATASAKQTFDIIDAWRAQGGGPAVAADKDAAAALMASLVPFIFGAIYALTYAVCLYLSGRAVLASGRLARPWPDVPTVAMPATVGIAAIAGVILTSLLAPPGAIWFLVYSLTGALFTAFFLQGLAAIHDRTRGRPARGLLLSGVYVLVLVGQGVAIAALSLFGLVDSVFSLRRKRRDDGRPPSQTPST
jgi:hypothetical protein